jgi:hypothetical protein
MKGLLFSLLATVANTSGHPGASVATARAPEVQTMLVSDWQLSAQLNQTCESQAGGDVTDHAGATVSLRCASDTRVLGNLSANLDARGARQRRVSISAELQVNDAMNASLWLKTQQGKTTLMFDDDSEQAMTDMPSVDGWVRRTVTLPVAADATQISFGVLLQGAGDVSLRDVRLTVSEPGAIAPEAAQLLDAAISIVKQHAHQDGSRADLAWQVLEPQLRVFTSGAQSSAEAYPAIKYLLLRLADKKSLLLTPEVASAFTHNDGAAATGNAAINIFTLPDGARLVLSATPAEFAIRTAQNRPAPKALP